MTIREVLEAAHQWLENLRTEYASIVEIEVLEDTDKLFRVVFGTENHMAELVVNEPDLTPYRFVSFQVFRIWENIVVREHFLRAAEEFGFEIIMPYCFDEKKQIYAFGYMPKYGSKNGAVICLLDDQLRTDSTIEQWCKENECFCSFLNTESLLGPYKRSYFRELLRDWRANETSNQYIFC